METTTPFDLNQGIQRWRENLGQSAAFRSEHLYELETHLRDVIATLRASGLTDEEAFIIAVKRLGKNSQLEEEFAKLHRRSVWLDRALWILLGAQLWSVAGVLSFRLQTLFQAAIPKMNELLGTYGVGRLSGFLPGQVFYVIALPTIVVVSAKLFFIIQRWDGRRGWPPLSFVLNRPRVLAVVYLIFLLAPLGIQYGTAVLVRWFALERFSGMSRASGDTFFILVALQIILLATIGMVVAIRRLRLRHH